MASLPPEELSRLHEPFTTAKSLDDDERRSARQANPTNENQLSGFMDARFVLPHNDITFPERTLSEIVRYGSNHGTLGEPDYLFRPYCPPAEPSAETPSLHAVMELKTFWKVTDELINELFDGNRLPISYLYLTAKVQMSPIVVHTWDDWQSNRYLDIWSAVQRFMEFYQL